jgi:hypothetical protein
MSRVFQFVTLVGAVILVALVITAILALSGHFDPSFTNPPS